MKTYRVETESKITERQLESIRKGVSVSVVEYGSREQFKTRPATIELEHKSCAILTIDEGKKRQIRRMFTSLDNHVTQLHRLGTEGMQLDDFNLDEGEFCTVSREEINDAIFS